MKTQFSKIVLFITIAGLSACGTNGVTEKGGSTQAQNNVSATATPAPTSSSFVSMYEANTSAWGTWSLTATSTANDVTQAYASRAATPPIDTDLMLKFRITAENASSIVFSQLNQVYAGLTAQFGDYSNFVAQYDCARYRVYVQVESTPGNWVDKYPGGLLTPYIKLSANGCQGVTSNVGTSAIYNVALTPGHGQVRLLVANVANDFYCRIGYWSRCPTYQVYTTHVVNAKIEIQTDIGYGNENNGWTVSP